MRGPLAILLAAAILGLGAFPLLAAPATLGVLPASTGPINCSQLQALDFHYEPGDSTPALRGYELTVQAGPELDFGPGDITDSGVLAGLGLNFFHVVDNGDGTFTVSDAILGPTSGLTTPADLFHIGFHAQATGSGLVQIVDYKLRDLDNVDIYATVAGAAIEVDCESPTSSADALAPYQGSLAFDVAFTASDAASGVASVELFFELDGGGYASYGVFVASPISFTAAGDGVYGFYTVATDAAGNIEPLPGSPPDALTTVDATLPSGSFVVNGGDAYTNSLSVTLGSAVTDASPPVEMRFDNDGVWAGPEDGWIPYAASSPWSLQAGGDGLRTVYAEYRDAALNVLALQDGITYDTQAPGAATGLNAEPANEEVVLTWTDPASGDLTGVEVWRGVWHDGANASVYPEYDDTPGNVIPARPASRAAALASPEWQLAGTAAAGDETFTDAFAPRGVYYYELFPVDGASNFGAATSANDRATNYWLGDVSDGVCGQYDGLVGIPDITCLGSAFGTVDGEPLYRNETDIGPTDSGSAKGIPQTDDVIDFEDLILFAINFDSVVPRPPFEGGSEAAVLDWRRVGDDTWALALLAPCLDLKGIRLSAQLPPGSVGAITAGALLAQQGQPYFLRNIDSNGLDVSLALMGRGETLHGEGELFRVVLTDASDLAGIEIVARRSDNAEVEIELAATAVPELPLAYRLANNFPNPFNPKTSIRFDLPEAQAVRLDVFDAEGRHIVRLLDEPRGAGFHSVVWDGRDAGGAPVASGVYFTRIEAGPLRETSKMLLLK